MALLTYILLIGIIALLAYQIKQFIRRKIMEKQNFNYYQCSGDEFVLINKDTLYHHSAGKKIAISMDKIKNIKISHKLIYVATENTCTLFCPKYGVNEIAKELCLFSPQKVQIETEKGLDQSIMQNIEKTSPSNITQVDTENS